MGHLVDALGQYLQATALDWKRLNSFPHLGQRYLRAATLSLLSMPACCSSGVVQIYPVGERGVLYDGAFPL